MSLLFWDPEKQEGLHQKKPNLIITDPISRQTQHKINIYHRDHQQYNQKNNWSSFRLWKISQSKCICCTYKTNHIRKIAISTTFSQQILSGRLLLVVMGRQKSNLSCEFKLEPITTFRLWFVVKFPLMICCKNVVDLAPLII